MSGPKLDFFFFNVLCLCFSNALECEANPHHEHLCVDVFALLLGMKALIPAGSSNARSSDSAITGGNTQPCMSSASGVDRVPAGPDPDLLQLA